MSFHAVVFGVLQGLFEWLPISSQGQLVLVMVGLLGIDPAEAVNYSIFLHVGTLLSVLVYFRRDLWLLRFDIRKYRPRFDNDYNRLVSFLLVSTIFTGIVGYPVYRSVTASEFSGEVFIAIVGASLIITGLLQKFSGTGRQLYRRLNLKDSILLGVLQGISVIPGISRSGITTSTFLLRNYSAEHAIKYSLLMSIPAVIAAEIGLGLLGGVPLMSLEDALLGIMAAFFVGILSIHVLLKLAQRISFWKFCVAVGLLSLVPLLGYLF